MLKIRNHALERPRSSELASEITRPNLGLIKSRNILFNSLEFCSTFFQEKVESNSRIMHAHHPFFIWARTAEHRKNGGVVPANYQLPEKRIEFFESNQQKAALSIYPNPANEQLILNYQGEGLIEVQLFDIKGSLLSNTTFSGEQPLHEMNVSSLKNGIYIIRVLQGEELLGTEKISIEH